MSANRITMKEFRALSGTADLRKPAKTTAKKPRKPTPFVAPFAGVINGGIEVVVPLRLKSLNKQENGFARHRRVKREHAATLLLLRHALMMPGGAVRGPWLVTVTRLGPVLFDEVDNNAASCKAQIDCVARWLEVSDGPKSSTKFVTAQEKSKAYGVRIRIEPLEKA